MNMPSKSTTIPLNRLAPFAVARRSQTDRCAQYTGFTRGNLYVNVNSAQHPNGEIRAQLLRTEAAATPTRATN